jgi:glyoxylase-like metal-dependent hydrolase (beta-lactamase superfamily II)
MNRGINASLLATAVLVFGSGPSVTRAQMDLSDVQIEAVPVQGAVTMLLGRGGNIGVSAGTDGILIVDDQFEPLAGKILEALAKLGSGKPRFILNTHWHFDHAGGNKVFGATGTIVAHDNVRKRLAAGSEAPFKVPPAAKEALPIITFEQGVNLHFNGEEIKAVHLGPGHTDGDSVIHFTKSNVIHMGDLFFNGMFPFIDLGSGGTVEGYVANVAKVLQMLPAGAKIIPGHGPLADRVALEKFLAMLKATSQTVRAAKQAGKTLDQVKAAGLGKEWDAWSWDFITTEKFIETLYNGL